MGARCSRPAPGADCDVALDAARTSLLALKEREQQQQQDEKQLKDMEAGRLAQALSKSLDELRASVAASGKYLATSRDKFATTFQEFVVQVAKQTGAPTPSNLAPEASTLSNMAVDKRQSVMDGLLKQERSFHVGRIVKRRLDSARWQRKCGYIVAHVILMVCFTFLQCASAWAGYPAYTRFARLMLVPPWALTMISLLLLVFTKLEYAFVKHAPLISQTLITAFLAAVGAILILLKDDFPQRSKDVTDLKAELQRTQQQLRSGDLEGLPCCERIAAHVASFLEEVLTLAERAELHMLRRLASPAWYD